ncbi:unnamed protein product [Boreogadus saida]
MPNMNQNKFRWNMPTHQCTVCDQTFGEKSNLARHLKIHAIARETFSCVVCGKSLATKPSLVSHQRLHQYPNIILYRQGEARLYYLFISFKKMHFAVLLEVLC